MPSTLTLTGRVCSGSSCQREMEQEPTGRGDAHRDNHTDARHGGPVPGRQAQRCTHHHNTRENNVRSGRRGDAAARLTNVCARDTPRTPHAPRRNSASRAPPAAEYVTSRGRTQGRTRPRGAHRARDAVSQQHLQRALHGPVRPQDDEGLVGAVTELIHAHGGEEGDERVLLHEWRSHAVA